MQLGEHHAKYTPKVEVSSQLGVFSQLTENS